MFDLFFSADRVENILIVFKPHESMTFVGGGEARKSRAGMLVRSTCNVVGDASVEDVSSTGDDVDVVVMVTLIHSKDRRRSNEDTAFTL